MKVRSVTPCIVTDANDNPRRLTNLDLQADFDDELAAGFGDVGRDSLKHLKSGAQKSACFLLDAVQCEATFQAGSGENATRKIKKLAGVRASAAKPNKEDAVPSLKLTLAMATKHDDLCWLVDHLDESMKVKIVKSQTELPGTSA
jgi:hypothetical protein